MKPDVDSLKLNQLSSYLWEIPVLGNMRVPGRIFANASLIKAGSEDRSITQVANVSELPGILGYSLAMPDIHWGYGFPIGGVAATLREGGVVSPGGVGYDINCGVRLAALGLKEREIEGKTGNLVRQLFGRIPAGVGSSGAISRISRRELEQICLQGSRWAVGRGFALGEDLERTEDGGCMEGADPAHVSERAFNRGIEQVGTLGSGNHFIEIGVVDQVYDPHAAGVLGLELGQVTVLIHTGSRGFGYQICDDYLKVMLQASARYGIALPDRQLCCAPLDSPEARRYLAAMACAANYAWANRQVIMALVAEALCEALGISAATLKARLVYDVSHNIAKLERHTWQGRQVDVCVHRKGATRAFGPGHPLVPAAYRGIGQPVLIPGDMGTASFVCAGTDKAMTETFGSTCHGAGRVLSRHQAKKKAQGRSVAQELRKKGIEVMAKGRGTLVEEMPDAYKDIEEVVHVMHEAGISRKVVRLRPVGVIKG